MEGAAGSAQALEPGPPADRRPALCIALTVAAVVLCALWPWVPTLLTTALIAGCSALVLWSTRTIPPSGSKAGRWVDAIAPYALLVFVADGFNALREELAWWIMLVILAVAGGLCFARWRVKNRIASGLIAGVGALLVPVFAVVGLDALWWAFTHQPIPVALVSFVAGAVLIGFATWLYVRPWWLRNKHPYPHAVAAVTVLVLVVAQPVAAVIISALKDNGTAVSKLPDADVSRLELIVLRDSSDKTSLPRTSSNQGWAVTTWVGQVSGDQISWGTGGKPPLHPDPEADRVLLLAVDGAPARLLAAKSLPQIAYQGGEVGRWLRLADDATGPTTPTFALLKGEDPERTKIWGRALTPPPEAPDGHRHGGVVSLQSVAGDRSLIDVALRYGVLSPTADTDLALAAQHRPALFFDHKEDYRRPLDVDKVLASGKLKLCPKGEALSAVCPKIRSSADLHNNGGHLFFDPAEIARVDPEHSTIYVNVTHAGNDFHDAIYLDYWWYLPDNPTGAGHGALCGAGFVLAGATCFDHQSDWEGVTVVLDDRVKPPVAAAVLYAQHDGTTRYPWETLTRLWARSGDAARVRDRLHQDLDTSVRPLVFVARGTHASYPTSCDSKACTVAGVVLNEKRHDGTKPWSGNLEDACRSVCVAALPTRRTGNKRALWNAFDGLWGTTTCFLGVICTTADPPQSPGAQPRYRHPWCAKTTITPVNGRDLHETRSKDEQCPKLVAPPSQ